MAIFRNTLRVISWCESLPKFFQQKHDEYAALYIRFKASQVIVDYGARFVGLFVNLTQKEEEQVNFSKARLKIEAEAYKYMSKLARMFSYVVQPLALIVFLPVAVVFDLGTYATNYIASIFKDQPTAGNNTETKKTANSNRANYNRESDVPRSPSMLNAYGNGMGFSRNDNTNKAVNNIDNPRKGLTSKP